MFRIIAAVLVAAALIAAITRIGEATPVQDVEWSVLQNVQHDGVDATRVQCSPVGMPVPGVIGGALECRITLANGETPTVAVDWYEDGSWRFGPGDQP